MSAAVKAAILADIATLPRVTDVPAGDLGYGSDLSCTFDLTERMDEVDGGSATAIAEALLRRADCPRGDLPDDADYGLGIREYLNEGTDAAAIRALAGRTRGEFLKDDRVRDCTVTVTPSPTGSSLSVAARVIPVDIALGPFDMTLAVSPLGVLLEDLRLAPLGGST